MKQRILWNWDNLWQQRCRNGFKRILNISWNSQILKMNGSKKEGKPLRGIVSLSLFCFFSLISEKFKNFFFWNSYGIGNLSSLCNFIPSIKLWLFLSKRKWKVFFLLIKGESKEGRKLNPVGTKYETWNAESFKFNRTINDKTQIWEIFKHSAIQGGWGVVGWWQSY